MFVFHSMFNWSSCPEKHPQANTDVEGVQLPLLIARDPAYPPLPWVMKGFSGPNFSEEEEAFNVHHSSIRVKVEHKFRHLKSRWHILDKRWDVHDSFMPTAVVLCCVSHNLCEKEKQLAHPVLWNSLGTPHHLQYVVSTVDQPNRDTRAIMNNLVANWLNLDR